MDRLNDIASSSASLMPLVVLSVGALGSLHCAGMCGPLLMASTKGQPKSQVGYQLGRLLSYLSLGMASGVLAQWFLWQQQLPLLTLLPSLLLAFGLIAWGTNLVRSNRRPPAILLKLYRKLPMQGPFMIGLLSVLLPCGFLYGVVLTVATFQSPLLGTLAMAAFWLGTLPALAGAPWLIHSLKKLPFKIREKTLGLSLVSIGLISLSWRFYQFYTTGSCH